MKAESEKGPSPRWISLGRACQILGVNETTLRHWADSGAVRSYRTPGGHRRFAEEDLQALLTRPPKPKGITDFREAALSHIRRKLVTRHKVQEPWRSALPEEERLRLRPLGRRLLTLASEYLTWGRGRPRLLEEVRAIGGEYGVESARHGLSLKDALRAFLFFRSAIDSICKDIAQGQDLSREQVLEMGKHTNTFMDEVLLATVASYESERSLQVRP